MICRTLIQAIGALALTGCTALTASAEGVPLEQTVFIAPMTVHGAHPAIAGIHPGMKADAALQILSSLDDIKGIREVTSRLRADAKGFDPYVSFVHGWENPADQVNVYLTSPASGNEVFAVSRKQRFDGPAVGPDFEKTLLSLTEQFGTPGGIADSPARSKALLRKGRTTTVSWFLGGGRRCAVQAKAPDEPVARLCDTVQHLTGDAALDLVLDHHQIGFYRQASSLGSDVIVVATVKNERDGGPVSSLSVSLIDVHRRLFAAEADAAALAELSREGGRDAQSSL